MAKIIDMPKLSPTMEEGLLSAWHKKEGDELQVDELLAEVETDKATMEFRSFDKGVLLKLLVPEGSQVKLGQPVAILGSKGEDISSLLSQIEQVKPSPSNSGQAPSPPSVSQVKELPSETGGKVAQSSSPTSGQISSGHVGTTPASPLAFEERIKEMFGPFSILSRTEYDLSTSREPLPETNGRVLASPYMRKVAREKGVDLSRTRGSGAHGRITMDDLNENTSLKETVAQAKSTSKVPLSPLSELVEPEVRALSPMRKTIARRLSESKQTVPHFYIAIDVDVEDLLQFREELNRDLLSRKNQPAIKISINDLLVKACAGALSKVPECNAQFTPEALLIHRRIDISVAVAVPEGLVTPVLRDADKKNVVTIAKEIRELAEKAHQKKLKLEEMQQGTFSISNLGMYGVDFFSAVINPPEGGILAVGQVREEPVVKQGAIQIGKRMALTLSGDHRVVDGAVGAAFLSELRELLTHPVRILSGG